MIFAVICGIIVVIAVIGLINSLNKNKAIDNNPRIRKREGFEGVLNHLYYPPAYCKKAAQKL